MLLADSSESPAPARPLRSHHARHLWIWGLTLAAFAFAWVRLSSFVVDDAGISFRYAQRLASGLGLSFNAGAPVEGYTNFTWCLLLAGFERMGVDLLFAARAMGWASWLAALFTSARLSGALGGDRAVTCLVIASSPGLVYWAGAGLETLLFVWLWIASRRYLHAVLSGRSIVPLIAVLIALPLTRPDGVLAVVGALACGWCASQSGAERRRWLQVGGFTALAGAVYAGWKLAYFGDLLPATFHAKSMPASIAIPMGLRYCAMALLASPWLVLALAARPKESADAPAAPNALARRAVLRLLYLDIVVLLAWASWVGGDAFPFFRFLIVAIPPAAVVVSIAATRRRLPLAALVLTTLWAGCPSIVGPTYRQVVTADRVARVGQWVGSWLDEVVPDDESVALNAIGFVSYASERPIVDMLGLTDITIATTPLAEGVSLVQSHARANGPYVLSLEPGVVILGNTTGSMEPLYESDRQLLAQSDFATRYTAVSSSLSQVTGQLGEPIPEILPLGFYFERTSGLEHEVDGQLGLAFFREPMGLLTSVEVAAGDAEVIVWLRNDLLEGFAAASAQPLPED